MLPGLIAAYTAPIRHHDAFKNSKNPGPLVGIEPDPPALNTGVLSTKQPRRQLNIKK